MADLLNAFVLLNDFEHWSSFRMLIKLDKILTSQHQLDRVKTYIGNHFVQEVFKECRSGIVLSTEEIRKIVRVEVSALLILDQIQAFLVEGCQRPLTCEEAGMFIVFCELAQRDAQLLLFLHRY